MKLNCKITRLGKYMEGTSQQGNAWRKQDFIVETISQYPQQVCLEAWGDLIDEVKNIPFGQEIFIVIGLSSREYQEKWYTSVKALGIDYNVQQSQYQQGYQQQQYQRPQQNYPQQQGGYQQRPQYQQPQQPQQPQYPQTDVDNLPFF